jgi:hypothetical protein
MGPMQTKPWKPQRPENPPFDALIEIHIDGQPAALRHPPAIALALLTRYIGIRSAFTATLLGADWIVYDGMPINLRARSDEAEAAHLRCTPETRAQLAGFAEIIWQESAQKDQASRKDESMKTQVQ